MRSDRHWLGPALSGARAVAMGAYTLGVGQVALAHVRMAPPPARGARLESWVKVWANGLLQVFGVEQHLANAMPARNGRARLVVANHRSPLDILLMLRWFGGTVLSRHDLAHWPLLGWAAREGGTIFVDRDDPHSGVKAIREIRKRLADGHTVIVFPEGTTHGGDDVLPFQGGAFAAVRGLDAELVPVGIAYDAGAEFLDESFVEHLNRVAQRRRTRVGLCVGAAQPVSGDREGMARAMRAEITELVQRARAGLEKTGRRGAGECT